MSTSEWTRYERRGPAAWITLASPATRNALSAPLVAELGAHLRAAMADHAVRAIALTGEGTVFCAGADLKNQGRMAEPGEGERSPFVEILKLMRDGPKPVIVAANGHAFAGGLGMVAAADIAISVEEARFGFSEVRIGVIPAIISVVVLPKLGIHQGMRLFLTGARFPAHEALGYGLVHRVVPTGELEAAVAEEIDAIAQGGPVAVREAKALVRAVPRMSEDEAWAYTEAKSAEMFASEEGTEGMAAFSEKRPPHWVASEPDPPPSGSPGSRRDTGR